MTRTANRLPPRAPAMIPGAVQFDMGSRHTGRNHRIFIAQPAAAPPPQGYPVFWVVDGNLTFPLAAAMSTAFALGGAPVLVVAVGYPTDEPGELRSLRRRDLTPPGPGCLEDAGIGGADGFLSFLVHELRPAVAAGWTIDPERQTLFGHALGGLFAIDALLDRPEAFSAYVASSPSIWWRDCAVLEGEAGFAARMQARRAAPRVLITVGAREQYVPARLPPGVDRACLQRALDEARMVDNARELAVRLRGADERPGYRVQFHAFDGEDHTTALPAAVGRGMAFALNG
ncbi:alpha/beta hydrolase [Caulobacter sp. KR2-114]|uniref:alpha/beta hydrolase n=1 Tax=Caulobacter sp. KR2-114 TaxID=3400912 RepID=UPI003C0CD1D1